MLCTQTQYIHIHIHILFTNSTHLGTQWVDDVQELGQQRPQGLVHGHCCLKLLLQSTKCSMQNTLWNWTLPANEIPSCLLQGTKAARSRFSIFLSFLWICPYIHLARHARLGFA
jgi:hypothetical protein